jgi:hypothetical protein
MYGFALFKYQNSYVYVCVGVEPDQANPIDSIQLPPKIWSYFNIYNNSNIYRKLIGTHWKLYTTVPSVIPIHTFYHVLMNTGILANFDVFVCFCSRYDLQSNSEIPGVRPDILDSTGMEYASFRIRIHLIRIQGFADQKLKKFIADIYFFVIKNFKLSIPGLHKGRPSYRGSLQPS